MRRLYARMLTSVVGRFARTQANSTIIRRPRRAALSLEIIEERIAAGSVMAGMGAAFGDFSSVAQLDPIASGVFGDVSLLSNSLSDQMSRASSSLSGDTSTPASDVKSTADSSMLALPLSSLSTPTNGLIQSNANPDNLPPASLAPTDSPDDWPEIPLSPIDTPAPSKPSAGSNGGGGDSGGGGGRSGQSSPNSSSGEGGQSNGSNASDPFGSSTPSSSPSASTGRAAKVAIATEVSQSQSDNAIASDSSATSTDSSTPTTNHATADTTTLANTSASSTSSSTNKLPAANGSASTTPIRFEAGTQGSGSDFTTQLPNERVDLNATGMTFSLNNPSATTASQDVIQLGLIGSNGNAVGQGVDSLAAGSTVDASGQPATDSVVYANVWNGIDATYRGNSQNQFEYDFTVNPGAKVSQVQLGVSGADSVAINSDGTLAIGKTDGAALVEQAPVIYQMVDGAKQFVSGQYTIDGNRVGFALGAYNHDLALVIDPATTTTLAFNPSPGVEMQTITLTATVKRTDGTIPYGQVAFYNVTSGSSLYGTASLDSLGHATLNLPGMGAGTYQFQANYGGYYTDTPSNSGPVTEVVYSANRSSSSTALTSSANPSAYGQGVTFTASVTGASGTPTSTVTFFVDSVQAGTGTLVNGQAVWSTSALTVSSHGVTAHYIGDSNYLASDSSVYSQRVAYNSTTTVSSSPSTSTYGQAITITARVTPINGLIPTGSVSFSAGGVSLGTATLDGTGAAAIATAALGAGSQTITATYNGDANYFSSSGATAQTVLQASTATAVSFNPSPSTYGQSVQIIASVTSASGTPTGNVTFSANGATLGTAALNGGVAVFNKSDLPLGGTAVTATYGGDANFSTSSGAATQTVNKGIPIATLNASPSPSSYGQSVSFTMTVAAPSSGIRAPTGTVTFTVGQTTLAPVALSGGSASVSAVILTVGNTAVSAVYSGDGNYNPITNTLTQTVIKAIPNVAVSTVPSTSTYGQAVTMTATVTGVTGASAPTGTVIFSDGSTTLGTATISGGQATLTTALISGGSRTISASYQSDANYDFSSGTTTQTVNKANTTTTVTGSPSTTTYGDTTTFTATVTGVSGANVPTGQVVFDDGTQTLGTATLNSSGVATFVTTRVSGGNRTITASFQGDGNYNTSSNTTTQTVNKAASQTALASSPTTSTYGQFVTLTATVTGVSGGNAPTGTVTFMDGSTTLGVVTVSAGLAVLTTQMLSVGSGKTLAANFTGDGNYNASSGSTTQTVNKATPPTGLTGSAATSNYGKTVTFTATVTGVSGVTAPTGTVTFTVGTMVLGTVALGSNGQAVLATAAVGGGANQTITATYNGDANYNSNYATTTLTVNMIGSMLRVSSSPNPSVYGQSVAYTATLSPNYNVTIDSGASLPTGTVTFTAGSVTLGTAAISNGVAVVNSAALNAGFGQAITATYNGDGNYTGSSGTTIQSVNKATPTVAVSGSPSTSTYGDLVTFAATITGVSGGTVPSGTVSFSSGSVQLGTATISNGQASLSTSLVSAGTQSVSALYQGDSNYNMASGSTTQTVAKAASSATVTSTDSNSPYGEPITFTATVTGVSGAHVPTGMVNFLDGTTMIGAGSLDANGQASFTTSNPLSIGSHSITAVYGGDANYTGSTSNILIQTVNNAVHFDVSSTSLYETAGQAIVTVDLATTSSQPVSVNYSTSDGTARAGTNYTATSGTLTFAPGQITATFAIPILNNNAQGSYAATVYLRLSNPINAVLVSPSTGMLNINDLKWVGPTTTWMQTPTAPPTVNNPGSQTNAEGNTISLAISASDPNGYPLTFDAVNLPVGLTMNAASGVISGSADYQAAEDFGGIYPVTVIVANSQGGGASASFNWAVADTPQVPLLTNPGSQTNVANGTVSLQVNASQPDGDPLFYDATNLPSGLSIDNSTGLISGTINPSAVSSAPYSVTVTATDNTPATPVAASQTFNWMVAYGTPVPSLDNPGSQTNAVGDSVDLVLNASDGGGYPLSFTAVGLPNGLSIDPNSGEITGTIASSAGGSHNTTVTATDGQTSVNVAFAWAVSPIAITAISDQSNVEGNSVSLQVAASESGATLSYSATSLPSGLSINSSTGLISGTVAAGASAHGLYGVDVKVSDGANSNDATFNWTITNGSTTAPVLTNPGSRVNVAGDSVNLLLSAHGENGDNFSYDANVLPDGLTIDPAAGIISGTVAEDAISATPYSVTVTATDLNSGISTTQTFAWTVNDSSLSVTGASIAATEGTDTGPISVATFTNPDPNWTADQFTTTINWGDSTSDVGTVSGASGNFAVTGGHTYAHPGVYNPQVSVSDGVQTVTAPGSATVTAAALHVSGGFMQGAVAGATVSRNWATFTDDNLNDAAGTYTAMINWGDGSTGNGTVTGFGGQFVVSGAHAYSTKGSYTVSATVSDVDGTQGLAYSTAEVGDVTVGQAATLTVATFVSSNPDAAVSDFTATINWGDGSSSTGAVTESAGAFSVQGTHTYAVDSFDLAGSVYNLTVTVNGPQGEVISTTDSIAVVRPDAIGVGDNVVTKPNVAFNNVEVAAFTDPAASDTISEFAATIQWGDGTSSSGAITQSNGLFHVLGSHTYGAVGQYAIQVTVSQSWSSLLPVASVVSQAIVPGFVNVDGPEVLPPPRTVRPVSDDFTTIFTHRDANGQYDIGVARGGLDSNFLKILENHANISDFTSAVNAIRTGQKLNTQAGKAWLRALENGVVTRFSPVDTITGNETSRFQILNEVQYDPITGKFNDLGEAKFSAIDNPSRQTFATLSTSWGPNVANDSLSLSLSLNDRLSFLTGKNVTNLSGQIGFIGNQAFSSLRSNVDFFGQPIKGFQGASYNSKTKTLDGFAGLATILDFGALKVNSWGSYSTVNRLQFGFNIHLEQSLDIIGLDRKFKVDFGYRPNLTGTPAGAILDDLGIINLRAPNARSTNSFYFRSGFRY